MASYRSELTSIPRDDIETWRLDLHRSLDEALAATALPEHPDYGQANEFLIRARHHAASARASPTSSCLRP